MSVPDAVLWDMDGTLIDTEPLWMEAEFALVAEHGGEWTMQDAESIIGSGLRDAARVLQEHGVVLAVDDIVNTLIDRLVERLAGHDLPWRPGARALLVECRDRGVPTALVTMSWRRLADAAVAGMVADGVHEPFDVVVAGDEVAESKPSPDPYRRAAALLGVRPEHCVAVEDSPTGTRSAIAAGCATVGVPAHAALEPSEGMVVLSTLAGLDLDALVARARRDQPA